MGKLSQFAIVLLDPAKQACPVFTGGEVINGKVIVHLSDAMSMRGIFILIRGEARVRWTERHTTGSGKNRRTTTRTYSAYETYIDTNIPLWGKQVQGDMSGDNPSLAAGYYELPFAFQLPFGLSSSFEGAWGRVRYYMEATIDKPWKIDHTTKRPFTTLANLDLNQRPDCRLAQENFREKTLCCLCCESGPITVHLQLHRTGFVPGEYIFVNATIKNNSNTRMDSSTIRIDQTISFHATSKTRRSFCTVAKIQGNTIEPMATEVYRNVPLKIPAVAPSGLEGCRIIDIQYVFELEVDPSGPSFDIDLPIAITIGTIPLADSWYYYQQYSQPAAMMPGYTPTAPLPDTMGSAPPPSYSEACGVGLAEEEDDDEKKQSHQYGDTGAAWAPSYTSYNYPEPSAPLQGFTVQPISGATQNVG